MPLKFSFNEAKALAALAFIAKTHSGFTPLFVSKILFFAEKWHLNRFGRPIIADTYIAMPLGPVPSTVKDYLDEKWDWVNQPPRFHDFIKIDRTHHTSKLMPGRSEPNLGVLSPTDIWCLQEAIQFCSTKSAQELSDITHLEKAWLSAEQNREMDYSDFIDDDNAHKQEILEIAYENAVYGVL